MSDLLEDIEPVPARGTRGNSFGRLLEEKMTPHDEANLRQLGVILNIPFAEDVLLELLRRATPSHNGHGYEAVCSGCGLPFQTNRRPLPNQKRWCDRCRETGEPAAQRARAYRERKSKEAK